MSEIQGLGSSQFPQDITTNLPEMGRKMALGAEKLSGLLSNLKESGVLSTSPEFLNEFAHTVQELVPLIESAKKLRG
ncbi:MAG: hypothetical protein JSS61_02180 [Verrucomicrobia bacterium]|nr:hypothetical protein [Verrucomicrobiota bacterium]